MPVRSWRQVYRAIEITDLTTTVHGLVKGDVTEERLVSDPTNGDPYDGGFDPLVDGTFFVTVDVPAGTLSLHRRNDFLRIVRSRPVCWFWECTQPGQRALQKYLSIGH